VLWSTASGSVDITQHSLIFLSQNLIASRFFHHQQKREVQQTIDQTTISLSLKITIQAAKISHNSQLPHRVHATPRINIPIDKLAELHKASKKLFPQTDYQTIFHDNKRTINMTACTQTSRETDSHNFNIVQLTKVTPTNIHHRDTTTHIATIQFDKTNTNFPKATSK
jgi:hypothetical protein